MKFGFDLAGRFRRGRSLNIMEYNDQTCAYRPGTGADETPMVQIFIKHKPSVILVNRCMFFPFNDVRTSFPIFMHGRPNLTLP